MRVTFAFRAERAESAVFVAGDFNGWSPTRTRLERMGDGVFRATVEMEEGRRLYKFVVDGAWIADPLNPEREADGHDGFNSVLVVGGEAAFDATTARATAAGIAFSQVRTGNAAGFDAAVPRRVGRTGTVAGAARSSIGCAAPSSSIAGHVAATVIARAIGRPSSPRTTNA